MFFEDVENSSTLRITEIREYIDSIIPLVPNAPVSTPRYLNTSKGFVFVQLYGLIEFTVIKTVQKAIFYINSDNLKVNQLKPVILSLALSPHLDSLSQIGKNKWQKRFNLFEKIEQNILVNIEDTLLPTNGQNIQAQQLESIREVFCISRPLIHDVMFTTRIKEIANYRINIAHGNISSAEIGSNFTTTDLSSRLTEVSNFCSHFIDVFNEYIANKHYLN